MEFVFGKTMHPLISHPHQPALCHHSPATGVKMSKGAGSKWFYQIDGSVLDLVQHIGPGVAGHCQDEHYPSL